MKTCVGCGAKAADDKRFCGRCGKELPPERASAPDVIAKRESFERRLAEMPADSALMLEYATFLASIPDRDAALVQLFKALELVPDSVPIRRAISDLCCDTRRWSHAEEQLRRLIELNPDDLPAHAKLVEVLLATGRPADAAAVLVRMTALSPDDVTLYRRRLELIRSTAPAEEVIRLLGRITQLAPRDADTWTSLGDLLYERGDRDGARDAFRAVVEARPTDPHGHLVLGALALGCAGPNGSRGLLESARDHLVRAREGEADLSPRERAFARVGWCAAMVRLGAASAEVERLLLELDVSPLEAEGRTITAECLARLGAIRCEEGGEDSAIACLEASIEIHDSPEVRKALASVHLRRGDALVGQRRYGQARETLSKALAALPGDAALSERLAVATHQDRRQKLLRLATVAGSALLLAALGAFVWTGGLRVRTTSPATMSLIRDGRTVARADGTDFASRLLRPGRYVLEISNPGFPKYAEPVEIRWGRRTTTRDLDLGRMYGTVRVDSEPSGAEVYVESILYGRTPLTLSVIANRSTVVMLEQGARIRSITVTVGPGETKDLGRLALRLPPAENPENNRELFVQPGDRVDARISNVDDIATVSVNGRTAVEARYSNGPGESPPVFLSPVLHAGANSCRFQVWNKAVCCYVSGTFQVMVNGKVLVRRSFARQDSREGILYDETVTIVVE